jgi:hypothetical protein
MDMRFGTWNVKSLCRIGSLTTVAKELGKYKLDLVGVQVRWEKGGTERAEDYTFFYGREWGSSGRYRFFPTYENLISG